MRAIDLTSYQTLTIPESTGELMRAMNRLAQRLGAARFAYVLLPKPFHLLKRGVYPRVLTNFPDHIIQSYMSYAREPFSLVIRAVSLRRPVYFSDDITPEEVYFRRLSAMAGLPEGVIIPIEGTDNAALAYAFSKPISRDWVQAHRYGSIALTGKLVHMAVMGRPELCPPFVVPGLTDRVREILQLKVQGLTNEEVACRLGIKQDTVKKALQRLSSRLKGLSTMEIVYHLGKMDML